MSNDEMKDFVGIPATVEAVRGARRSEENARAFVVISLPITESTRDLISEVMMQIKNKIFIGFGFMQGSLPFDDASNPAVGHGDEFAEPDLERLRMIVNGEESDVVRPKRSSLVPHPFHVDQDREGLCLYCRHAESDDVHDTPANLNGVHPEDELSDAARKLVESARVEPETDEERQAQEAAASLAARSRAW